MVVEYGGGSSVALPGHEDVLGGARLRVAVPDDLPLMLDIYARARRVMADAGNLTQWGTLYPRAEVVADDVREGRSLLLVDDGRDAGDGAGDGAMRCGSGRRASDHDDAGHDGIGRPAERVLAQFALCRGRDPAYASIDGRWLDDDPYVTIHRIASSGVERGSARRCLMWAVSTCANVRVDTHRRNSAMLHILESLGFTRCGVITTLGDATLGDRDDPHRIAFQRHDRIA